MLTSCAFHAFTGRTMQTEDTDKYCEEAELELEPRSKVARILKPSKFIFFST